MKEIKYNTVGDYEFPSLKQERPLPNLSRFGREYLRILKINIQDITLPYEQKMN